MKRISSLSLALVLTCILVNLAVTVGCAGLQRSPASGYAYDEQEPSFSRDRRSEEHVTSLRELGYQRSELDLSSDEQDAVSLRTALRKAERLLSGKSELEQYYKNKAYMRGDDERLEFLQLDSYEDRQRWLNARGIRGPMTPHLPVIQSLIDVNDITLNMTKQAVRDSWGEPELIEVSGNPVYGNERWHFSEQTSSEDGYQTQRRVVTFESGRVIGWETR